MQNLMDNLIKVIKADERIFAEGKLLKNKLTELALKLDPVLLTSLLGDKKLKESFFAAAKASEEKLFVFDRDKFIEFINNKEFLPDSFTSFKNRIGLMSSGEYIKEKDEVVLAWPYKDCVLEGGQDKEDQARDEIFYNEVLAPDEIDRLFEEKVLTNFKRIDSTGDHKLDHFADNDNLIIRGNNLLALQSLKKRFSGQIKLIYIDPPYNTGTDGFHYNDSFNHSTWLTFMKNRLKIARDLLKEDGIIFIQCDDNESAYLKVLMDEIFGRGKYGTVSLQKTGGPGPQTTYDYTDALGRIWKCPEKGWRMTQEKLKALEKDNRLYLTDKTIREKYYLKERLEIGKQIDNFWGDIGNMNRSKSEDTGFIGQKPEKLIERIINLASQKDGDIVLDFFMGSGTTAAVAHKMKKQFVGIEQMDYGKTDAVSRLKNVFQGEIGGISSKVKWQGGGSFVYLELNELNESFVADIKKAETTKALLAIYNKMKKEAFFRYEIDLSNFEEKEFSKLSLKDQKQILLECLDKNHLYVNYGDIDDATYKVSAEDKKLNKEFYGF